MKTKQKRQKTSVYHPRLPLLAAKALWPARAQAIPLGLTVVRTSQEPQPASMVRSAAGTKHCKHKLWKLSILIKHCRCACVKRSEKALLKLKHCARYKALFYVTMINRFALNVVSSG